MPNKKRRSKNAPALDFELPPTTLAKTANLSSTKSRLRSKRSRTSKNTFEAQDDTPKAFTRLMAFASGSRRPAKGPDNGRPPQSSKRKRTTTTTTTTTEEGPTAAQKLTINPGESLREFNRRVDASLPVPLKVAREPRKPRAAPAPTTTTTPVPKDDGDEDFSDGGTRRKRRRGASPDPWAVLERRDAPRFGDVAPAPPSLHKPKAVLHSRGIVDVDGVPRGAGSLARREGLAVERRELVEAYRRMMQGKRGE